MKSKTLLYIAIIKKNPQNSYYQKVKSQTNEFKKYYECNLITLQKNKNIIFNYLNLYFKIIFYLIRNKVDIIYLRHPSHNALLILIFFFFKISFFKKTILEEIPTYPLESLNFSLINDFKGYLNFYIQIIFRSISNIFIDKYFSIGGKGKFFFKNTVKISNGINYRTKKFAIKKISKLHMVAIANLSKRHGYDRLIKMISKKKINCTLTIIGDGAEKKNLMKLVKTQKLCDKIFFLSYLNLKKIKKIINKFHIGIGNLAFDKINVKETSALKELLYLEYGLPVLYSGKNKIYTKYNNKIFFKFHKNKLNDIDKIQKFTKKFWLNKNKNLLFEKLYEDLSWKNSMKKLINYLKNAS